MSRVYWDSMLFIYWFEGHPEYSLRLQELHERIMFRHDTLCTSIFTIGEVLIGPYRQGATEIAAKTRELMRPPLVEIIPFNSETTEQFARIRAVNRIPPADAIHLASAA